MHERVYRALLRANQVWRWLWGIKMEKRDFRYCCGTAELGNFSWSPSLKEFRELIKEARMANKGKEMKFSLRMSEHDRGYRIKRIVEFLRKHDTVLLTVALKGREQARPDLALNVLASLVAELEKVGKPSGPPVHKGRVVQVLILPK